MKKDYVKPTVKFISLRPESFITTEGDNSTIHGSENYNGGDGFELE